MRELDARLDVTVDDALVGLEHGPRELACGVLVGDDHEAAVGLEHDLREAVRGAIEVGHAVFRGAAALTQRRHLAAAQRPHHEWHAQAAQKAGEAQRSPGQVVDQVHPL